MGTAKRERQRANRALKQQQSHREETRRRGLRIGMIIAGAFIAVLGLVWIVGLVTGDDDTTEEPTADVVPEDDVDSGTDSEGSDDEASQPDEQPVRPVEETIPEGCPPAEHDGEPVREFDSAPPMCLDPAVDYGATVETNKGTFTIDLEEDAAPVTTNNFVFLARNGYFDGTVCHRIIPGFVVQCGDPTASGSGGPGYSFDDELPEEGSYEIGSIAMANSGPNTNGSQFFIITGEDGASLPPLYSLFGAVTDGFESTVVEMEAAGSLSGAPSEDIEIVTVTITTT